MSRLPRLWDGALEAFLQTRQYTAATVHWSDRVASRLAGMSTLVDAVNQHLPGDSALAHASHRADDATHTRQNQIRRMILAPLSPRKPTVIPCPAAAIRQPDKHKLEKVVRQRARMSALLPPVSMGQKENARLYRPVAVSRREFSSMRPIIPTFYWGP
jgi:hypothetical protein